VTVKARCRRAAVLRWMASFPERDALKRALEKANLAWAEVRTSATLLDSPTVVARDLVPASRTTEATPARRAESVPLLAARRASADRRHDSGKHNAAVLGDWLGLDDTAIESLRERRVLNRGGTDAVMPLRAAIVASAKPSTLRVPTRHPIEMMLSATRRALGRRGPARPRSRRHHSAARLHHGGRARRDARRRRSALRRHGAHGGASPWLRSGTPPGGERRARVGWCWSSSAGRLHGDAAEPGARRSRLPELAATVRAFRDSTAIRRRPGAVRSTRDRGPGTSGCTTCRGGPGAIAVACRKHARMNPNAVMRDKSSRWRTTSPRAGSRSRCALRLLLETDGACAVIVASPTAPAISRSHRSHSRRREGHP